MPKREKTRDHPTNSQVQRIKKDIRSLRDSGKSDTEIRETLGLELRTYQKYMHILHLEDQKIWLSITQEQLASELLRLRSSLEENCIISKKMVEDPKLECGDKIEALNCMNDSRLNVVKLLVEYPDFKRAYTPKDSIEPSESDNEIKASTLKRIH